MATSRSNRPGAEGWDLSDAALDVPIGDTATPNELGALFAGCRSGWRSAIALAS
jgi:hypothetical protein